MRTQATVSETCSNGVLCSENQRIVTLEQKLQTEWKSKGSYAVWVAANLKNPY